MPELDQLPDADTSTLSSYNVEKKDIGDILNFSYGVARLHLIATFLKTIEESNFQTEINDDPSLLTTLFQIAQFKNWRTCYVKLAEHWKALSNALHAKKHFECYYSRKRRRL